MIPNSDLTREIAPFGYLRADSSKSQVYFYVLVYNYPKLFQLLQQLTKWVGEKTSTSSSVTPTAALAGGGGASVASNSSSTSSGTVQHATPSVSIPLRWRQEFDNYVSSLPHYYLPYLRKALKRYLNEFAVAAHLLEQLNDQSFTYYPHAQALNKLRHQAKTDVEQRDTLRKALRTVVDFIENPSPGMNTFLVSSTSTSSSSDGGSDNFTKAWQVVRPHVVTVQRANLHSTLFRDQRLSPPTTSSPSPTPSLSLQSLKTALAESVLTMTTTTSFSLPDFHEVLKRRERVVDAATNGSGVVSSTAPGSVSSGANFSTVRSSDDHRSPTTSLDQERILLPAHLLPHSVVFDIDRPQLLDVLERLQERVLLTRLPIKRRDSTRFTPLHPLDPLEMLKHSVPIAQMSNFQDVIRKRQLSELRNPESESSEEQVTYFGNPFLKRKKGVVSIGETAAVDELAAESPFAAVAKTSSLKRKPTLKQTNTEHNRQKRQRKFSPSTSLSSPSSLTSPDVLDSVDLGVTPLPSSPSSVSLPPSAAISSSTSFSLFESVDELSTTCLSSEIVPPPATPHTLSSSSFVVVTGVVGSDDQSLQQTPTTSKSPIMTSAHALSTATSSTSTSTTTSQHALRHALRMRNNKRRWKILQLIRSPPRKQRTSSLLFSIPVSSFLSQRL